MEEAKEVKVFKIEYKCPECDKGYLRPTGVCLSTNPPQYPHKCSECNYMETFWDKQYPIIEYH